MNEYLGGVFVNKLCYSFKNGISQKDILFKKKKHNKLGLNLTYSYTDVSFPDAHVFQVFIFLENTRNPSIYILLQKNFVRN